MIGQTIVGEVEEDRLILVHVAWNVAGHWIMNEPPGVLISFCKTGKAMCMLSLGRSLLRVLRLCIAPWLFGGRSSYFAGTHSIMNGFELSTTSFRIGAVIFSAETHETRRRSAGNKTKMCMAFFKTVN